MSEEDETCQTCRYNDFCEADGCLKLSEKHPDCRQGRDELDEDIKPDIAKPRLRG